MEKHPRASEGHGSEHGAEGARIGMWLFLISEILLFGGLFLLYSVYRFRFAQEFHAASLQLSRVAGTANTAVLLTSSLAVALALFELRVRADAKRAALLVAATIALGAVFLAVKGFEWAAKFRAGLYPNSPVLLEGSHGEALYVGLYFAMTGLHAVHVIVGMAVLGVMLGLLGRGRLGPGRVAPLENAALYWHLVDIVWIFLFPLFYLIS
jgi:cytochrome c oxidase subunit III